MTQMGPVAFSGHAAVEAAVRRSALVLAMSTVLILTGVACGAAASSPGAATDANAGATPVGSLRDVVATYTRFGPGGDDRDLEVTYASRAFFDRFGQDIPTEVASGEAMLFLLRENVHEDEMPVDVVAVALRRPDGELVPPTSVEVLTDDPHHRSSRVLFEVAPSSLGRIEVVVVRHGEVVPTTVPFVWDNPAELTQSFREGGS